MTSMRKHFVWETPLFGPEQNEHLWTSFETNQRWLTIFDCLNSQISTWISWLWPCYRNQWKCENRRSRVCAHIKLHTRKLPSHSSKKSRPLWAMMMDDNTQPTHERMKLIKTYKNALPPKRIVVVEVCGETYSKEMIKRWSRKTATNLN